MKFRRFAPALLAVGVLGATALVFFLRPPALVVSDDVFASIYGTGRIRLQRLSASLMLFRQVKPVSVADGASADMILFAIGEASSRPFCVIFPSSFADSARRFHTQSPEIPVLIMENRGANPVAVSASGKPDSENIFVFKTDTETDLYRAGQLATILGAGRSGDIVLFYNQRLLGGDRNAFTKGFPNGENAAEVRFFSQFSQFPDGSKPSCAVLAGSGAEFLDQNTETPVILFSWLDPALTSQEIKVIFDDSVWALAVPAVRALAGKQGGGAIPSKVLIFSARVADNVILRELKKILRKKDAKSAIEV